MKTQYILETAGDFAQAATAGVTFVVTAEYGHVPKVSILSPPCDSSEISSVATYICADDLPPEERPIKGGFFTMPTISDYPLRPASQKKTPYDLLMTIIDEGTPVKLRICGKCKSEQLARNASLTLD